MDVLRRSLRISRWDRIWDEEIRRKMVIMGTLFYDTERKPFIWYGYVQWFGDK